MLCQQGRATYAFLGILTPTSMHLSPSVNAAFDWNPEASARTKSEVKRQAANENWLVAPVGRDEWVRASELESIAAFSAGKTTTPEKETRRRERTAAPVPAGRPTEEAAAPSAMERVAVPA